LTHVEQLLFHDVRHCLEIVCIHLDLGHSHARHVLRNCCWVYVIIRQVLDVRQRVARIVDSDAALAIRAGVQQSRLDVQVCLVLNKLYLFRWQVCTITPLELVNKGAVLVKLRTQNQIVCFVFDLNVSVSRGLRETI